MLEEVRSLRVDFEDVVIGEEVQVESPSHTQVYTNRLQQF